MDTAQQPQFVGYPEPRRAPDFIQKRNVAQNPIVTGRILAVAAFIMEWVRFIREIAWANAGFSRLREIREVLEDYEPRYYPTIFPAPAVETRVEPTVTPPPDPSDGLEQATNTKFYSVADYRALFLSGKATPTDVARTLLQIIRGDSNRPSKHAVAWMDVKEDLVMKAAEAATLRYKENRSLGPLDGVPTAIKDDYDLDGYATMLGSKNDYASATSEDGSITSWCIRKLEGAGVVILGKLSMHEYGMDITGNNPHYGTPLNPFNSNYYPGGSSSGPAYVVSTGLVPFAMGSDGGGSIRIPASYCSVFGLKPTHGRISMYPGFNSSPTCAVQGPLAADIRSLATVYQVIADPHPSTKYPPLRQQPSLPLTRTLGFDENWLSYAHPGVQNLVRNLMDVLSSQYGYQIIPITVPFVEEGQLAHAMTILTDAASLLPNTKSITPDNKILLSLGRTTPATDYLLAQKVRMLQMQHLAYVWKQYPGMLIITPTTGTAGSRIRKGATELKYGASDGSHTIDCMRYVWMANFLGLPSLTVPAGYLVPEGQPGAGSIADEKTIGKIPVGFMATGEWCSEEMLLRFGLEAESAAAKTRSRPPIWEDLIGQVSKEELLI